MTAYAIIQGDTLPSLVAALTVDDVAVNLTGATATLAVTADDGAVKGTYSLTLSGTPTDGIVTHAWTAVETAALAAGSYGYSVRVLWGSAVRTFKATQRFVVVDRTDT